MSPHLVNFILSLALVVIGLGCLGYDSASTCPVAPNHANMDPTPRSVCTDS